MAMPKTPLNSAGYYGGGGEVPKISTERSTGTSRAEAEWATPTATGMAVVPEAVEHHVSASEETVTGSQGADALRRLKKE